MRPNKSTLSTSIVLCRRSIQDCTRIDETAGTRFPVPEGTDLAAWQQRAKGLNLLRFGGSSRRKLTQVRAVILTEDRISCDAMRTKTVCISSRRVTRVLSSARQRTLSYFQTGWSARARSASRFKGAVLNGVCAANDSNRIKRCGILHARTGASERVHEKRGKTPVGRQTALVRDKSVRQSAKECTQ